MTQELVLMKDWRRWNHSFMMMCFAAAISVIATRQIEAMFKLVETVAHATFTFNQFAKSISKVRLDASSKEK